MAKKYKGKLIGGLAGFFIGGPIGAILGAMFGDLYDKGGNDINRNSFDVSATRELAFIGYLVTLFVSVAKADMSIDRREIETIKTFFRQNFSFSNADYDLIDRLIKKASKTSTDLDKLCYEIKKYFGYPELLMLLRMLYNVALSDRQLNKNESTRIDEIVSYLNISQHDHYKIRQEFVPSANSYAVLGIDNSATDSEIKKAYRELVKKYHPDRVSHLGDEFVEIAKRKFQSIQDAYNKIRIERGI